MNISRTTIYINITALIIFVTYITLNSIQPIVKKKVEIEKKNKVLPNVEMVNLKNDLIIKDITLPELEKRNLNLENKKNFKLSPLKKDVKNNGFQSVKINPIDYNDIRVKNLDKKLNNLSIMQPVPLKRKIETISIKTIKRNPQVINQKDKVREKIDKQELIKFNKSKLIYDGKNILENIKDNFAFEFRWPLETKTHNKIYNILNECLFSQTVLLNNNNQMFDLNGLIKRNDFAEKYSSIIRMPNNVYSEKENTIIKQIRRKYLNSEKGRHLRIFYKNTDAYIIGYLLKISKRNNLKFKKIQGQYLIEDNKLYLDKLVINDKPISNRILLSHSNKRCYGLV
ncbi:hypothetical protein N9Y50_05555 [Alphaproteobacteria bacterium]|nr:hypothetical protein [Alphaproteobacteria bacterium]